MRLSPQLVACLVLSSVVLAMLAGAALTATSVVPASRVGRSTATITANKLKPSTCTQTLAGIKTGSGGFSDTSASNLVLGSAAPDTFTSCETQVQ